MTLCASQENTFTVLRTRATGAWPTPTRPMAAVLSDTGSEPSKHSSGGHMSDSLCRCGHPTASTDVPHPCHGKGYTCRAPATSRLVAAPTCLAGAQMKLGAYETWACDECWEWFKGLRAQHV